MDKKVIPARFKEIARNYYDSREQALNAWKEQRSQAHDASDTRSRIFNAARTIFSQKGHNATVREICHAADANVSAVNYHFGNKNSLLAAVLEEFLHEIRGIYPMHGGVTDLAEPEERLFGFTLGCVSRMLLWHGEEYRNLNKLLLDAFINDFEEFLHVSQRDWLELRGIVIPIIDAMTGNIWGARQLDSLTSGYFSQLFFYAMHIDDLLSVRSQEFFTDEQVYGIAQHITAFSIGGIKNYSELMDAEIDFPHLCDADCGKHARKLDGV
ncbi:TetR/AcrR family transcriptional regulator [Halodesulfovibrio marinisediminis]|uniref:Transcriptional regulator, TetR family n=1 Tax=Halodesulfovibrio marinisediminis DSM 17456 TaxID=1121457 RepID=A0A1N6HDC2_9BACT|nr:TetR/AcrR family transcriptional regulator [Halodesulfovibrio marinisediminis]SIO17824.1 transcriptional regulator, TetR family [Halodesulfovibrio marinisediminis DSM 17456]